MKIHFSRFGRVLSALALGLSSASVAFAHGGGGGGQHGGGPGHLPGYDVPGDALEFISKFAVPDAGVAGRGIIADLAVHGNHAYLARWGGDQCAGPERRGQQLPDGGVYVIDISNLSAPKQVAFIATNQDTLIGEGMQVLPLSTTKFRGDVLAVNHEQCGKNGKGGFSLYDVSNPARPRYLSEHIGDTTANGVRNKPADKNQMHSVFMWQNTETGRAYLVATDDDESADVDIFDITDPRKPVMVGEFDLNVYGVSQPDLLLTDSFLHDMVVKKIGNNYIMLLSYWDGGYVLLNVNNPAAPVYMGDTDYAAIDPEFLVQTGSALTPEGNGHQAEFSADNKFVIATDEDFGPFRLQMVTDGGDFAAKSGSNTSEAQLGIFQGVPVFVGRSCNVDPNVPAATPGQLALVERGECTFTEKAANVLAAGGYTGIIIMNREGADACTNVFGPSVDGPLPVVFVGRDSGFAMLGLTYDNAACLDATQLQAPVPIGSLAQVVLSVVPRFDGWGYVHLFGVDLGNANPKSKLISLDTWAIPEAMSATLATGYGDLSVHEVATHPTNPRRAYLSHYSGGMRALDIVCTGAGGAPPCTLQQTGAYIDVGGNDFWGVEVKVINGETIVFGSDRDTGLYILKDPRP